MQSITPQFGAVYRLMTDARPKKDDKVDLGEEKHAWLGLKYYDPEEHEGELADYGFSGEELADAYRAKFNYYDEKFQTTLAKIFGEKFLAEGPTKDIDEGQVDRPGSAYTEWLTDCNLFLSKALEPFKKSSNYGSVTMLADRTFYGELKSQLKEAKDAGTVKQVEWKDGQLVNWVG